MSAAMPADHRARLALGVELLERYDLTEDRAELDEGIEAVAAAIEVLPMAEPMVAYAHLRLTDAYWVRSELDDNAEDLGRAVATGEAAAYAVGPEHPAWPVAHSSLALAYESRWRRSGEPTDLDGAIRCRRVVLDSDPSPTAAAYYGDLLRERSEFTRNPGDLRAAIVLLERVVDGRFETGADLWPAWHALGRAYQRQAEILKLPDRLDAALDCFDRALQSGPAGGEHLLNLHHDRLLLVRDAVVTSPGRTGLRVIERASEILAEAGAAGESPGAASSPTLRTQLAGRLAAMIIILDAEHIIPPTGWDLVTMMVDYMRDTGGARGSGDALAARMAEFLARDDLGAWERRTLRQIMAELLYTQATRRGDLHGRQRASEMLRAAGLADPLIALTGTVHAATQHAERGDLDRFNELARQAERDLAALPDWPVARTWIASLVDSLRSVSAMIGDPDDETAGREPPGDLPDSLAPWEVHRAFVDAVRQYGRNLVHPDPAELRAYGEFLTRLARSAGPYEGRFASVGLAGSVWLELARLDRADPTAARTAATHFEQALAIARGPEHPNWPILAIGLGESLRLVSPAHHAQAREWGRSGLHSLALNVFLQAGTDYAIQAAQRGSEFAAVVAGWCLADRAYDDLLSVLDAGRGLVLASATASRDVARRLTDAGHTELAAEWRATSGLGRDRFTGHPMRSGTGESGVTDDLRTRVIRALYAGEPDTVSVTEVQRALGALEADALVYLIPSGDAVIVPAHGDLEAIALPGLAAGPETMMHRWADASSALRDLGPLSAEDGRSALDDVCAWAWTVCVGRLVERARTWRLDRPARIVLVPMGPLGLVPWHAAFTVTAGGGRRRYAVEEIGFSYTISARVLCTSARHPIRPIESAIVIGNPEGNLPFAGIEAAAVHQTFYPNGVYLERSATPARVLDWLASATGPSLLHLACHATTDPRLPADAHLVLAGGATLAARELIEVCRVAALPIDRVFLAACTTSVTGTQHDEAFSLATAFLAAGAHTVFGTLWPIRDQETSLFMYVIHHHLNVNGCTPSDALHRAQRWMLDPHRQPPPGMPARLATHCRSDALARPIAWAGFTHLGR